MIQLRNTFRPVFILLFLCFQCAAAEKAQSTDAKDRDYWAIEDAREREKLPLYKTIPAAKPEELTPANGYPTRDTFLTWHRSHGDNGGMRYSALEQINLTNVAELQQAWIYHSADGSNNLQCNPIIVGGMTQSRQKNVIKF